MTTTTEAKERPILFSGEMVRAILEGRKTQTRQVIKPQPAEGYGPWYEMQHGMQFWTRNQRQGEKGQPYHQECPYGQPGNRLWVRETWKHYGNSWNAGLAYALVMYRDETSRRVELDEVPDRRGAEWLKWRPSIHMPRWASRLTLEITGVRVERVQDISQADAKAEGAECGCRYMGRCNSSRCYEGHYRYPFAQLWDQINASRGYGWAANPWCWVIDFRRVEP